MAYLPLDTGMGRVDHAGIVPNMYYRGRPNGVYAPHNQSDMFNNPMFNTPPPTTESRIMKFDIGENKKDDYDLLDDDDEKKEGYEADSNATTSLKISPYWALVIFVVLFIAIEYWVKATDSALNKFVFDDERPKYWHYVIIASVMTLVFLIMAYVSNVSISVFETL